MPQRAITAHGEGMAKTAGILIIGIICHLPTVDAQDDVKYCQILTTGEIKVVKANMPCPYPMAEM